ncbi:unnamed protein product [Chironomus riparius]|uniref:Uncharacterized protein n=1 Tax=Chironomus riparius TaxID=315576 RepID=A0A9N9RY92_9DIPT|nr:unnamed protein product [Chironomus riparius]
MTCSFKKNFLCCFPLLSGCLVIGIISSLAGTFLLIYTLATIPVQRLSSLKTYYYFKYVFFLTILAVYYVALIYAGISAMYGVVKRLPKKLLPLFLAMITHPFMVISYNNVYATDWNGDHYNGFQYSGTPFFERNGVYIFIIGLVFAAYSAFCIYNSIKMIEDNQIDKKPSVFKFKILEFSTFFGIMPLKSGGLIIGTASIILGIYFFSSMIVSIPFEMLSIQDTFFLTMYYGSLAFDCIFHVALVIGGILMIRGVLQKNYENMKPLMIILFIQPAMIYFFFQVYNTNNSIAIPVVISYITLTILGVYSAFCIKNLRKIIKNESLIIDESLNAKS